MGVARPEDLHLEFTKRFNAGSVEQLAQLYEPSACLVPQPGVTVKGHAAVKESLQRFLALRGSLVITTDFVIKGEGVALLRGRWTLTGTGPDGKAAEMNGKNVEVARQQSDGTWLFALDHAFGAD